jgi:hypothetical protein
MLAPERCPLALGGTGRVVTPILQAGRGILTHATPTHRPFIGGSGLICACPSRAGSVSRGRSSTPALSSAASVNPSCSGPTAACGAGSLTQRCAVDRRSHTREGLRLGALLLATCVTSAHADTASTASEGGPAPRRRTSHRVANSAGLACWESGPGLAGATPRCTCGRRCVPPPSVHGGSPTTRNAQSPRSIISSARCRRPLFTAVPPTARPARSWNPASRSGQAGHSSNMLRSL